MTNIQLSISLLASDKPAALERCLDSLRPLMMKVPSELIVVLTGMDERVRRLASSYTDQIVDFTWCDDFSAARNAGLKLARGEWFLYIDDDEWFEDTKEICDFFLSGEYRKFGIARYIVRNYLDKQGTLYSDYTEALRMVKMVPSLHFINPIHEELVPRSSPCKYLNAYVHHYGYVNNKKKTDSEKNTRNITLLLEDIKKRPSYTKNYVQIVQIYKEIQDWKKAEEYCREGLKRCRKAEEIPFRRWLQSDLIEIIYAKGDFEKAEEEILGFLERYKPCEIVRLTAYLMLSKAYIKLKQPEKSVRYGRLYEETLTYMDENPELWCQQRVGHLSETKMKNPHTLYQMRINCVEQALSCGNKEEAVYFLSLLPWGEEEKMQQYYHIFDYLKETYTELFGDILKNFSADSPYLIFQRVKNAEDMEQEERQKLLEQCVRRTESYHLQYQVVKESFLLQIDVTRIITVLELDIWKQCAEELVTEFPEEEISKVWAVEAILKTTANFHALLLEIALYKRQLIYGYAAGQEFINILIEYSNCILTYYKKQYSGEMFQEEQFDFLPKECRFGVFLAEAMKKLELKEFSEAVRLLRAALSLDPAMTGVIQEVLRLINNMLNNPAFAAGEEFQTLAVQMKETLKSMIQNKQYQEAVPVMQQLCTLLPGDLELLRLRQKLLLEMDN